VTLYSQSAFLSSYLLFSIYENEYRVHAPHYYARDRHDICVGHALEMAVVLISYNCTIFAYAYVCTALPSTALSPHSKQPLTFADGFDKGLRDVENWTREETY
jgi:hypothetical protein